MLHAPTSAIVAAGGAALLVIGAGLVNAGPAIIAAAAAVIVVASIIAGAVARPPPQSTPAPSTGATADVATDVLAKLVAEAESRVAEVERTAIERIAEVREAAFAAEEGLLSTPRAQAIADAVPLPLCVPDPPVNRFALVNAAFANALGYTVEEMIGHPWDDFIAPELAEPIRAQADDHQASINAGASDATGFDCVYIAKDGSRVAIGWDSGPLLPDGSHAYYIGRA